MCGLARLPPSVHGVHSIRMRCVTKRSRTRYGNCDGSRSAAAGWHAPSRPRKVGRPPITALRRSFEQPSFQPLSRFRQSHERPLKSLSVTAAQPFVPPARSPPNGMSVGRRYAAATPCPRLTLRSFHATRRRWRGDIRRALSVLRSRPTSERTNGARVPSPPGTRFGGRHGIAFVMCGVTWTPTQSNSPQCRAGAQRSKRTTAAASRTRHCGCGARCGRSCKGCT
jgi:hypothetical protein